MNFVPADLFKAYLVGGTKWPQIRGGINIYLLNSFGKYLTDTEKNLKYFFESSLSDEQI